MDGWKGNSFKGLSVLTPLYFGIKFTGDFPWISVMLLLHLEEEKRFYSPEEYHVVGRRGGGNPPYLRSAGTKIIEPPINTDF